MSIVGYHQLWMIWKHFSFSFSFSSKQLTIVTNHNCIYNFEPFCSWYMGLQVFLPHATKDNWKNNHKIGWFEHKSQTHGLVRTWLLVVGVCTLGGQNYCHIVLFFRGTVFKLQPCHYYERFSQCFAYYGRSIPKEIKCQRNYTSYFILCDVKIYLHKKMYVIMYKKLLLYFLNDWVFLIFIKFVISTKHCNSIWLEWFFEPCEKFDDFHITNGFFQGNDHKYVLYWNFDKQSLSNGGWQETRGGSFKKIPFQMFLGWLIIIKIITNQKP